MVIRVARGVRAPRIFAARNARQQMAYYLRLLQWRGVTQHATARIERFAVCAARGAARRASSELFGLARSANIAFQCARVSLSASYRAVYLISAPRY